MINFDPDTHIIDRYEIHFDEATHTYTVTAYCGEIMVWREVKRSVTQVLKDAGIVSDYSGIDDYYRERGTLVHHYCTLLAEGWLEWDKVREDCLPYVRTFEGLIWQLGLEYVSAEQPCYDEELDYCGTYDLIMMWSGKRTLVELKTGTAPMWLGLQLAAYERMVDVDDVIGISLKDGKVFIKADDWQKNHENWKDINSGWFMLDDWKANRNRRHMKVLKGER